MNNPDIEKRLLGKGASKDLNRYTWKNLTQNGTGKALPKCAQGNFGNEVDTNAVDQSAEEIEKIGCIGVPGNPWYAPKPGSNWSPDQAKEAAQWLLNPGQTASVLDTETSSPLEASGEYANAFCTGTAALDNDSRCQVGIIDGTGNIVTGGQSAHCDFDKLIKGREENINKAYGGALTVEKAGKGSTKPLLIGGDEKTIPDGATSFKDGIPAQLIAMNKTWGQVQPDTAEQNEAVTIATGGDKGGKGGWWNGGILADNIRWSKDLCNVKRKKPNIRGELNTTQHLIELSARGDFFKQDGSENDPIIGVYKPHAQPGTCGLECTDYKPRDSTKQDNAVGKIMGYDRNYKPTPLDVGARTGACVVTRDLYGPGYYEATVWIPKTDWEGLGGSSSGKGRGYVFAMWMFQYTESYTADGKTHTYPYNFKPTCQNCTGWGDKKPSCWSEPDMTANPWCPLLGGTCKTWDESGPLPTEAPAQCDTGLRGKKCCTGPAQSDGCTTCTGDSDNPALATEGADLVTTWGSEIDIEIPSNAPGFTNEKNGNDLGWNTYNCNPWWGDMEQWEGEASAVPYSQEMSKLKTGDFTSEDGFFHTLGFEWVCPPVEEGPSVITWFFDGQPVHRTSRYAPNRVGRLVIGPWPASWGGGDGRWMPFETATVYLADLSIIPYTDQSLVGGASAWPQSQDQAGLITRNGEPAIGCDFKEFASAERKKHQSDKRKGPHGPPFTPGPGDGGGGGSGSGKGSIILWVIIGVLLLLIIGGVIWYFTTRKKGKGGMSTKIPMTTMP
jgi:hypothetical protein